MRWFYRAIGGGAWPMMRSHVSWCTKAMRVSLLRQNNGRSNTTWFSWRRWWRREVWNNGCFVRLGRCGIVIWRLIAHYYYWAGTSGVRPPYCSALLFGAWHVDPVAICPTCQRQEVQNSWKGASTEEYTTEFMKGSDLVLEKSVFTEYVPTRVYRAHLKNIRFFVW